MFKTVLFYDTSGLSDFNRRLVWIKILVRDLM